MSGWRITSWDRELARGTIASGLGEIGFDAAVALTDDFRLGEAVDVSLRPHGATYEVTRIAPVAWRAPHAPAPRLDHAPGLAELRSAMPIGSVTVRGLDEDGSLTLQIETGTYEPPRAIVLDGCAFVQLPAEIDDLATVSAYSLGDFARECPAITDHWPELDPTLTVFRFEPRAFGEKAGYAVAHRLRVTTSPSRWG